MNNIYRIFENSLMYRNELIIILIYILLITFLSSCAMVPSRGDHIVLVVKSIPTRRQQLQYHPGFSLALKRGVTRDNVKSGQVVISGCYYEKEGQIPDVGVRHGYSFIPAGVTVERGDVIEITAEEADGTDGTYARFFGRYTRKYSANESEYFPYEYTVSGKAFKCGPVSPKGVMQVEVFSMAESWYYDLAKAEELRNDQISDKELEQGRIAICECAIGVDSRVTWKVRIHSHFDVKVGDYIEAIAGSIEASHSIGQISAAIQKVAPPLKKEFSKTYGRYTVNCNAVARPRE